MDKGLSAVIFGGTGAVGKVKIIIALRHSFLNFWHRKNGLKFFVLSGSSLNNGGNLSRMESFKYK